MKNFIFKFFWNILVQWFEWMIWRKKLKTYFTKWENLKEDKKQICKKRKYQNKDAKLIWEHLGIFRTIWDHVGSVQTILRPYQSLLGEFKPNGTLNTIYYYFFKFSMFTNYLFYLRILNLLSFSHFLISISIGNIFHYPISL